MEKFKYRNIKQNYLNSRAYSTTTNMNQSSFTKSLHELRSFEPLVDQETVRNEHQSFYPPKNSKLNFGFPHKNNLSQSTNFDTDDRPVLRKKRFTRRQRKSVTIEPETGLILATGPPSSSDEEGDYRLSTDYQQTTRKKSPIRQQQASRILSASTFELSLNKDKNDLRGSCKKNKYTSKGPAARRAERRLNRLQYKITASTNNLDQIEDFQFPFGQEKRSMSVRDLNGEECDFSNQDSVTRWTSQILAELDSLPSSCIDLTKETGVKVTEEDQKWSKLSPQNTLPAFASFNARMTQSTFIPVAASSPAWQKPGMTTSVHSDWKPVLQKRPLSTLSLIRNSEVYETQSKYEDNNTNEVLDSNNEIALNQPKSLQDLRLIEDSISDELFPRSREHSLTASTIVGSSSDTDDSGTPIAVSPEPNEAISSTCIEEKRSIGVQGPETPLFYSRVSTDYENAMTKSSFAPLQIMLSDDKTNKKHILSTHSLPLPAKRTTVNSVQSTMESTQSFEDNQKSLNVEPEVAIRMRPPTDILTQTDEILMKNIGKLDKMNGKRLSQQSISSSQIPMDADREFMLKTWKKQAECRSRLDLNNLEVSEVPSVDRVIASLIRTVEETRFTAPDRPHTLGLHQLKPQDATTQTSPFSISRSSSFDWIHDMSENRLRDLDTPVCTPRSEKVPESSSETDDADREVAEVTKNADFPILGGVPKTVRKSSTSGTKIDNNRRLIDEMEESIAMLLQYGQENKPNPIPRKNQIKTEGPSRRQTQEIHRPIPQFPMSESIYDNMSTKVKSYDKEFVPQRDDTLSSKVAKASVEDLVDCLNDDTLTVPISQRAGSCELLNNVPKSPTIDVRNKLEVAEEEALECCQWLRCAGFPQYAKQYEEGKFPIDLRSVKSDHEFLEADSLRALFRRLDNLNRCAIMRIDNVVLRRRNDNYVYDMYGCDEDDNVALSGNWQYQRNSHTWSRVANEQMYGAAGRIVSTSQNTSFSTNSYRDPYAVKSSRHSPYDERSDLHQRRYDHHHHQQQQQQQQHQQQPVVVQQNLDLPASKLSRSQSERIKDTAKAWMKRMNPRSGSRRRRDSRPRDPNQIMISEPVLVSYDSASPESMRMMKNTQISSNPQERGRSLVDRSVRSKSAVRRQGIVLMTPTSPESSSPSDDSFRQLRHRERSVPPRPHYSTSSSPYTSNAYAYDRSRFDRTVANDYLYNDSASSLNRSRGLQQRNPYLDSSSFYYGSGASSPIYSSPFSNRSFQTPVRSRQQLNIQPDGYFMHGSSFEISPDTNRRVPPFTSSPSTSSTTVLPPQLRVDTLRNKSQSSLENTDEEPCCTVPSGQNRRDSGVGSSLSRSPSGPSSQRIRQSVLPYYQTLTSSLTSSSNSSSAGSWNGTATKRKITTSDRIMTSSLTSCTGEDIFFSDEQLVSCVDGLSCSELHKMRKLAYLQVTAILEKYMGIGNAIKFDPFNSSGGIANGSGTHKNNWTVHKLIKKIKQMDSKTGKELEENTVFGQPLEVIYKRSGHCLPRSILEILRYLRQMAPDTVGMFRKNGVKSRINELRAMCDRDTDADVFVDGQRLDAGQVHDVADLLKQYLRELPDPLMTSRLSEVFAGIFMHVPDNEHLRLSALQFAIFLLPDENREALQTLLLFLADVSKYSEINNMPAQNLSVCFTPSLFHLSASRLDKISANRRHKTIGAAGMPTEREMRETKAAQMCLTFMIQHVRSIFLTPERISIDRNEYEENAPLLKDLSPHGPRAYLMEKVSDLIKENADRWKGWIVEGHLDGVEISSKKASDFHLVRPLRVWVDVPAPPKEVMYRLLRERSVWDVDVINWRSIDTVNAPDTDIHQYVINDTIGHPTRDCYVVRYHRSDIPELSGASVIAERSIQCGETQLLGGISATVLDVRFLIEPKNGYSRVTYLARIDLKGRSSTWYNKVYSNVLARQMVRLRESFRKTDECGPETKV